MRMRMMRRLMGVLLLLSMLVTTALLVVQGRWQEAIPLHLCSVSALLAAVLSFKKSPAILDFLWYLGMPGAVLALIFPAPASSVMQPLFTAGYVVTHALIAAIPLTAFAMGEEPRQGNCADAADGAAGPCADGVFCQPCARNEFFVFSRAAAGYAADAGLGAGLPAYILLLQGMMLGLCLLMSAAHRLLFK